MTARDSRGAVGTAERGAAALRRRPAAALALLAAGLALAVPLAAHVPHDSVTSLAASPGFATDGMIFGSIRGNFLRSRDGGNLWHKVQRGLACPERTHVGPVVISPTFTRDRTVFLGCDSTLFRSDDGGSSFVAATGPAEVKLLTLVLSPRFADDGTLVALTGDGELARSTDRGMSWERLPLETSASSLEWIDGALLLGTRGGELRTSADAGATWRTLVRLPGGDPITAISPPRRLGEGPAFVAARSRGIVAVDPVTGEPIDGRSDLAGTRVTAIARLHENGELVLLATGWEEAVYRSEDLGASWQLHDAGLRTNRQADDFGTPHFGQILAPGDGSVFVGSFCGVFRSDDGGRSWYKVETIFHHVASLQVSPATGGDYLTAVTTYGSGVMVSADRGESWTVANTGLRHPRMGPIAFSPQFARDRTLFVGTFGLIARSRDGGGHWEQTTTALQTGSLRERMTGVLAWTRERMPRLERLLLRWFAAYRPYYMLPTPLVIAVSPDFARDGTVFAGMEPNGIVRSTDGGSTFSLIWSAHGMRVRSLAISPDYPRDRMLLADVGDRVFRSLDGGDRWQPLDLALTSAVFAFSPGFADDRTVFAGGKEGLFRSHDAGRSWQPMESAPEGTISAVALSPVFPEDRLMLVQEWAGDLWICRVDGDRIEKTRSAAAERGYEFSSFKRRREFARPIAFSPHFSADRTVFGISGQDVVRSTDGGLTWTPLVRPMRYEAELGRLSWFLAPVHLDGRWFLQDEWVPGRSNEHSSRGIYAVDGNARAEVSFIGTGVTWLGGRGPRNGRARVSLDGELRAEVDQTADDFEFRVPLFSQRDLPRGRHVLTIELVADSSNTRLEIDAFDVIP